MLNHTPVGPTPLPPMNLMGTPVMIPSYVRYSTSGHYIVQEHCTLNSVHNENNETAICRVIKRPEILLAQFYIPPFNCIVNMDEFFMMLKPGDIITTFLVDTKTGKPGRSFKFVKSDIILRRLPICD